MNTMRRYSFLIVLLLMVGMLGIVPVFASSGTTEIKAPSDLQLYNPKVDTVLLQWSKVKGAEHYYVYISEQENSGYQMVCGLEKNQLVIEGLKENTVFYFKVYAFGKGTVSKASNIVSGKSNIRGIDVSKHNGVIDWEQVKKSGLTDFAIIRCGYGDNMQEQDDYMFEENVAGCEQWDIPMGVYLYSYADNTAHAQSEADHVLRLINGKKFPYKVWYDLEDSPTVGTQDAKTIGDMAETFCNSMLDAGYEVGIYANKYWFTTILTDERFERWPKWVAQYNDECTYDDVYIMWQNTSDGSMPGIEGRVDLNYAFTGIDIDLKKILVYDVSKGLTGKILKPEGLTGTIQGRNSILVSWEDAVGSSQYAVYRSTEKDYGYQRIAITDDLCYQDNNIMYGKNYYYKVRGFNSISTSEYSEEIKVRLAVNKLTHIKAEARSYNKIKLTWNSYSDGTGVEIYRSLKKGSGYNKIATTTKGHYVDQNVMPNTKYYYLLRAYRVVNEQGLRIYSAYSEPILGMSHLNTVQIFSITVKRYDRLKLVFSEIYGATGYEIYRSTRKNGTYRKIAVSRKGSYTDVNLSMNVTYFYKVCAIREENGMLVRGAYSERAWQRPKVEQVTGYSLIANQKGTVQLKWDTIDGVDGYMIYRCSKRNGTYTRAGTTTKNTFVEQNRKSGTICYYKVRAYRIVNGLNKYGAWSAVKKVTIQ